MNDDEPTWTIDSGWPLAWHSGYTTARAELTADCDAARAELAALQQRIEDLRDEWSDTDDYEGRYKRCAQALRAALAGGK